MLKRAIMAVVFGVIVGVGAGVYAAPRDKGECRADVEKFCAKVEKGEGRVVKCLHDHLNELSSECKENIEDQGGIRTACKDDKEKYCSDDKRKGGDLGKCLKDHEADLSTDCKDAVTKAKED